MTRSPGSRALSASRYRPHPCVGESSFSRGAEWSDSEPALGDTPPATAKSRCVSRPEGPLRPQWLGGRPVASVGSSVSSMCVSSGPASAP